jgi:hypothetical protein
MTCDERWNADRIEFGWTMPSAPWWKRLWGVRHFRAALALWAVERHDAFWLQQGKIPTGYDDWVIYGMVRGWEAGQ